MENKIDLSKISIKETATKTIKANFEGTEKEYQIRALTDSEKADYLLLCRETTNVHRYRNAYVFLLESGMDLNPDVAGILYDNCRDEAVRVASEIFEFSKFFDESKAAEKAEAEKNSAGKPGAA